jgi:hypothetical protein
MRTKTFKLDYIYNVGKNMSGQRIYMTGEEIINRYTTSIGIGLNKQQAGKLRKIARQILDKEKGQD